MPQKRWRIDGNFVASPGEFLLQGNPTVQRTHCAVCVRIIKMKANEARFLELQNSPSKPHTLVDKNLI